MTAMKKHFLQIHFLTSYPSALLNRDDAGFAKRIPFGGAVRTRISSQCLKRHWRSFDGEFSMRSIDVLPSIRSRSTFERYVVQPLLEDGLEDGRVHAVTAAFMKELLGESAKAKKAKVAEEGKGNGDAATEVLNTGQVTILGRPEVDFIRESVQKVCSELEDPKNASKEVKDYLGKGGKKNLKALRHSCGLDAALFGRMVTSDMLSRKDAAIHVAHALTVHREASESDYFSAVDDLRQGEDGELGSGHINSTELTSGLYYGYVVLDLPLLIANLEGCSPKAAAAADRELAVQVVERMVHLVATVSPGAKLGSTAPYANANLVLIEAGNAQPRTFANAFLKPVKESLDLLQNTYEALAAHIVELDRMYGKRTVSRLSGIGPIEGLCQALEIDAPDPLDQAARWAAAIVREG